MYSANLSKFSIWSEFSFIKIKYIKVLQSEI